MGPESQRRVDSLLAPAAPQSDTQPVVGAAVEAQIGQDPRSERVRAQLFSAATALGADGATVTVSGLARRAGVSRSVFYVHFADLADFALHLQRVNFDLIAESAAVERGVEPHEAMLQSQRRLVAHFSENRQLYRAAFSLPGGHGAVDGTKAALAAVIRTHITAIGTMPTGLRTDLVAEYTASAVTGLLSAWLLGQHEASEEELAQHLYALLSPWMHGA